jgi:hypothetical protein
MTFQPLTKATFSARILLPLIVLLVVGSALRFYGLSNQSLWYDETCSWHTANYDSLSDVAHKD